ncbi:FtsX-like permease family protein [Terracidiphilus sp.]|jgi:ABC-type antimicrobial peptide transport system permease subunit|uniref:FtsX-like permease family protein n=1 Tax=Terracidiphilus sp. TaxID=1964191 RepID=UPI003C2102BD
MSRIDDDLRLWKVITISGATCACMATIILAVGFFGIVSLHVSERRREIGIQIALGANKTQVCTSMMKRLRRSILIGLAFGSVGAILAAAGLAELYSLSARSVFGGYIAGLVLLGMLLAAAAYVPLRRALAVSPIECLSSE